MLLLLAVSTLILAFIFFRRKSKYWENRGVPGPKPLPLVGNFGANIIARTSSFEIIANIYRQYEHYPFVGIYRMGEPCLLLRDPEIIKNILVKDFNSFPNNDVYIDKKLDPLVGLNPFVLKNEEWKKTRQLLTPGFAPAKIKTLFPVVEHVAQNFVRYLAKNEGTALNVKEICGRFTCDVIASGAFGIDGNCFEDPNAKFLQIVRKFVSTDTIQGLKVALAIFMPHLIKVKLVPQSFDDDMINITKDTQIYRQENNIKRNDYFEAISHIPDISLVETAAHLTGFVADGYETTSTGMTFMFYELAANPACQQKLREEINTVLEKNNGQLTYEALKDMTYLEACINESLRLHPPLAQLSRNCNKTYTVSTISPELKKLSVTLDPGTPVIIPLLGLHRDPKYFPSPNKFIPERFLEKSDTHKYVYLPFGTGQRTCLGSRLGLLQSKVGIATVIKNFEITLDKEKQKQLKYDPFYFLLAPKGGAWINCRKISQQK